MSSDFSEVKKKNNKLAMKNQFEVLSCSEQ